MTSQRHHSLPPTEMSAPPVNSFTVLVIDDLDANRLLLRKVLSNVGYHPIEAADAEEGLSMLLGSVRPHLIITDVEMPGMNGIEAVRTIRAMSGAISEIPIIAASGNPTAEMEAEILSVGADQFLTKPFELKDLLKSIRTLLQQKQPTRIVSTSVKRAPNHLATRSPQVTPLK